ncbi:carboxymuconolactone decarboxylase family protein [Bradyrhizobium japonicum]|uniref:carboxymuconolactone decarboxylase family protein n=1 Tax=Bradyrhizobium japonicum TaxID=375 RepID=UPI001BA902E7|nr:carboxymuconolactone decarboxylase family protein [Bradyrhizobium japonicum]MBR0733183.1 carboxymuconolactone decarboxylase family protein [Bradyrhizobium japonicum]
MKPRSNIFKSAPDVVKALMEVEKTLASGTIEPRLAILIKLRASQMNSCAFCVNMHVKEALKVGDTNMRLHMLSAWRESSLFSERERAALAWTEALTKVAEAGAPDSDYATLQGHFSDQEISYLTLIVGAINLWNRTQIGLRADHPVDESDRPAQKVA